MTAFSSWAATALLWSLAAPGDAVLVQFSSQRCAHCEAMRPVVARLADQGCPVQIIDVDLQPEIAQQYRVTGVPTFVALARSRETGRIVGATTYERLAQMYREAGRSAAPASEPPLQPTGFRAETPGPGLPSAASAVAAAQAATVRLKVEDASGYGFGTGTIIDVHDQEALVVTCGHLFRESQGQGRISADVFAGGAAQTVPGQLLAYDLDRDIALVSVRAAAPLQPVLIAPPGHLVRPGDRAFSIGCDKGADPSVRQTHITAVNKYQGKPNFTAAGQPLDGRSGGGLFSAEGLLIGICNAADPADDEGLYAGLASIHWQLDQIGQAEIYQRAARLASAAAPTADGRLAAAETPATSAAWGERAAPAVPPLPPQMPRGEAPAAPLAVAPASFGAPVGGALRDETEPLVSAGDDTEIVFIVRSKRDPAQRSEVFVVDQAPPDLVARISHAARTSGEQRAALARARSAGGRPASGVESAALSQASNPWDAGAAAIVRGQTAE